MSRAPAPLALDFAPARRRPGWLGWLLLGLGLVAVAAELAAFVAARADLAERESIVARLQHQAERRQPARPTVHRPPPSVQEAQAAVRIAAQLNADWAGVFASLAGATGDDVTLLEIVGDAERGTLALVGDARTLGAAFDYVARLEKGGALREARLERHEWASGGAGDVLRFSASARWGAEAR